MGANLRFALSLVAIGAVCGGIAVGFRNAYADQTVISRSQSTTPDYLRGTKALTAATPTSVVAIPIAAGAQAGGSITYSVESGDATERQQRFGRATWAVVNVAGTETCAMYGVDGSFTVNPTELLDGSSAGAISSSTLTYTWSVVTTGTNICVLTLTAASGLTETYLNIRYRVEPIPIVPLVAQ